MKTNRKGGIVLKILAVLAFILMIIAIEVPRRMWIEQGQREELARKRMIDMNECEIAYNQENSAYEKDLKKVYDYITTHNMAIGAPEMETEILTIDTTSVRISFNDYKHVKDLVATRTDKQEIIALPGMVTRPNEHIFYCGNEVKISLQMKDEKLGLYSDFITISSTDSVKAIAIYKNEKDIFWDFSSTSKLTITRSKAYTFQQGKDLTPITSYLANKGIEILKSEDGANQTIFLNDKEMSELASAFDPTSYLQESQNINMARYLLTDVSDTEPYLCPSTKEPFKVDYNLSGKFFMKIKFFKEGTASGEKISSNDKVKNYFINIIKLKTDRKVNDFVREKEVEGDSSFSKPAKKKELFSKYFNEFLTTGLNEGAVSDSISNTLTATDATQEQDFSDEKKNDLLLSANAGQQATEEAAKPENAVLLNKIYFSKNIGTAKIDVTSLKISSPITEQSSFRGYTRSFLQSKALFGVTDDKNHGSVDNGRASWKKE